MQYSSSFFLCYAARTLPFFLLKYKKHEILGYNIMHKFLLLASFTLPLTITGCDYFKNKKDAPQETVIENKENDWSCTNSNHIEQIKANLKQTYLAQLNRNLRESNYYNADQDILQKIQNGISFEIKNIRTVSENATQSSLLACESELVMQLPKGLQKRAENAYAEFQNNCEEECGDGYLTLQDYLQDAENLKLNNEQLTGSFYYNISKTDQEGLNVKAENASEVLNGLVFLTVKAVQYAAYIQENQEIQQNIEQQQHRNVEQVALAQKAMDIRQKELNLEKVQRIEKLNLVWDNLIDEQRQQLQQDQKEWFEKRDVDCKVISQKSVYQIPEEQRETYQRQANYWDEKMEAQNTAMQYSKCFNQRTAERTVYLQNYS